MKNETCVSFSAFAPIFGTRKLNKNNDLCIVSAFFCLKMTLSPHHPCRQGPQTQAQSRSPSLAACYAHAQDLSLD